MKEILKIKATHYSKEILKFLLLTGMVCVAASSPYFVSNLIKNISKARVSKKKFTDAFTYLRKRGLVKVKKDGYDVRVALTEKGEKAADKYRINDLAIRPQKKWDQRWRVVVFDIPTPSKPVRDAFRKKLKDFDFYPLQKVLGFTHFRAKEKLES
jgi:DNA-binding transcriptional regulator PaaX